MEVNVCNHVHYSTKSLVHLYVPTCLYFFVHECSIHLPWHDGSRERKYKQDDHNNYGVKCILKVKVEFLWVTRNFKGFYYFQSTSTS